MRTGSFFHGKIKRIVLLVVAQAFLVLSGCSINESTNKVVFTTGFAQDEVFRIEDSVCSLQEMMVYLINTQNGYESAFGTEVWAAETDDGTVEKRLKDSVLAKIAQIKAMNLLAVETGIALDESEIAKADEAAEKYFSSLSEDDIEAMGGVTKETILQIYSEYALADKLYRYIIRDINPEISDDEARTITVEQIVLKTYSLDANGDKVPFNETQRGTVRGKAKSIKNQLLDGASFEELMSRYNEAEESTISFGKGDKEEAFEVAAFNLGNEQVSDIIEISEGYAIIKCISTFNREETEYNKIRIVEERKREVFGEQYDVFVSTLTKELNEKLWDDIAVTSNEKVTTSDIWEIYEEYFGA